MEAIILAGGFGKRLRSIVKDVPKPMARINGYPFLDLQIRYWIKKGINRFILSVGYKNEVIQSYFGKKFQGAQIDYSVENQPLGTGGAVLLAKKKLRSKDIFLILNGDTYFDVNLKALIDFHLSRSSLFTLSLFVTEERGRYDIVKIDDLGRVLSLQSTKSTGFANGGVSLASVPMFDYIEEAKTETSSLEKDLLNSLLKKRTAGVFGLACGNVFIDIGLPADFQRAHKIIPSSP